MYKSKVIWDKKHSQYTMANQLRVYVPKMGKGQDILGRHKMPSNVFFHKEYPICKCGRKYVPIKRSKECFYCLKNNYAI